MNVVSPTEKIPAPHQTIAAGKRFITLRAILVGMVGVLFVSILTPFNDFIMNTTPLVGSYLPVVLVLFFMGFVLLINAPLRRLAPRFAFGSGELAVALCMTMVSCAIPGSAFLRFTCGNIVGIWTEAAQNGTYQQLLDKIHLPSWMFPTTAGTDVLSRARDPVIRDYLGRVQVQHDTFLAHWNAVPWHAWITPAIAWGILFACMAGIAIFTAVLVRRQWEENERLAFPLGTLLNSLIEEPKPGRSINETFRNPGFIVAFIGVFLIHCINGLHEYFPARWPIIPLEYDLQGLFTQPPWIYIDRWVSHAYFSFMLVGITYFISTRLAFSVWACMLLVQIYRMITQFTGGDWPGQGYNDHSIGSLLAYTAMIIWLGRAEWAMIIKRMLGMGKLKDPTGAFAPYAVAGWGLLACITGMATWLVLAGTAVYATIILVGYFLVLVLVLMRIVAETGIFAIQFLTYAYRPWQYVFLARPSIAAAESTLKPYFLTEFFTVLLSVTQRESLAVYSSQSLRVAELAAPTQTRRRWQGLGFLGALALALTLGFITANVSNLYYEYKYAATLNTPSESPINKYGVTESATYALQGTSRVMTSGTALPETISPTKNFLSGAAITGGLAVLTLRYAWWPIHPLGYLLLFSWTTWALWPSVFMGWAAKSLILRLGGSKLYRTSQPFFIGLILGECAAIGVWLCVSLICVAAGWQYHAINISIFDKPR